MRYYELTYLIPKNLSEAEKNSLSERIFSYLPAQPEKKQGNHLLMSLEFNSEPENIEELEKKLKSEQSLRYMILIKEVTEERPKRPSFASTFAKALPTGRQASADKKTKEGKGKKVELKEIEEKLDEILGQ